MGQIVKFPTELPRAAISRIAGRMVTKYSPREIGDAIELLMDLLDFLGGDPDAETGNDAEDDFAFSGIAQQFLDRGPGCPVSDAGDIAYAEWATLRASQKRGPCLTGDHEDDEDGDPKEEDDDAGQSTEDEISHGSPSFGWGGPSAAGCPISDPGL